jgi:hypothetical protein
MSSAEVDELSRGSPWTGCIDVMAACRLPASMLSVQVAK